MSATFAAAASRLAGLCGAALGWSPEQFWRATPAEVGAIVAALCPAGAAPVDGAMLAHLREKLDG